MENNFYESERNLEHLETVEGESLGRYTAKTFFIMFVGLMVSFGVALFIADTWPGYYLYWDLVRLTGGYLHIILLVAQLALSFGMTSAIQKSTVGTTWVFFLAHCALIGLVVGAWLMLFDMESAVLAFAMTALCFGGMAVFGYFTQVDLSRLRNFLLCGLVFLILANVLMWFIPAIGAYEQLICSIGIVLFLAYAAYDTQMIRRLYEGFRNDGEMLKKASVYAALQLCLDFVNLFLYILRLLGRRSRN